MTKTRQAKLADCVELLSGFAFKSQQFTDDPDDVALVKGENVSQGRVLWDISKRWPVADWDKFAKFQLTVGDVVIAMDRPWVPAGLKWCFIRAHDTKALLVQRCCRLRAMPSLMDQTFLRCVVGGPGFESYIKPITTGVNIPHISGKQILDYAFNLPDLPTQRKIAGILSAYDDLIENNLRRIKILEQMAQSLYREWFVHFRFPGHESVKFKDSELGRIPEGWEAVPLGDLIEIRKGKNITKTTIREGNIPVVAGGLTPAYYHDTANTVAPVVTISASGANAGFVNIYFDEVWTSDCSFIDRKATSDVFYFYLLLTSRQNEVTGLQRGSAQPHVYPKDLMALEALSVPPELRDDFTRRISPLFELVRNLHCRNQTLRRTRDLLLPKLLS